MAGPYIPRKLHTAFSEMGETSERLKALITLHGNPQYASWWDDFLGDALDARYAATVGAGTEVIGVTAAKYGNMTLTTGANANDSAGQGLGLHWDGDSGFYFIARLKLDTITNAKFEIGVTDAVNDDGAVATKATPTFTATDCALFVFDTTDDGEVTFVSNGGTSDANADATDFTLAADTFFVVEVIGGGPTSSTGDNVTGYINGQRIGSGNINGSADLTPWAYVETLTTATRTLTLDWWGIIGPRRELWGGSI